MIIIQPLNELGWIIAIIDGRLCHAKVYDMPSRYGINGGRVSILTIQKVNPKAEDTNSIAQLDYNYSRGLDFDNLPEGVLNSILKQLEALPSREQKW